MLIEKFQRNKHNPRPPGYRDQLGSGMFTVTEKIFGKHSITI